MRWLGVSFEAYAIASSWGITSEARDIFSTAGGVVRIISRLAFGTVETPQRNNEVQVVNDK